jgi:hypothetical protein
LFFLGLFCVLLAAAGMYSGDAWTRYGRVIRRDEEPRQFWLFVAAYYIVGFGLVGYFLHKVYRK